MQQLIERVRQKLREVDADVRAVANYAEGYDFELADLRDLLEDVLAALEK